MRVLGIDTSLRSTGIAVVESEGSSLHAIEYKNLKVSPKKLVSECLKEINEGITDIIDSTRPDVASIEGAFFCKNIKTAMVLGEVRGAAMAVCSCKGLDIYEYAPRRIKQAIVGFGSAGKEQVRKIIMKLLALQEEPQEDIGDAFALAICHLHSITTHVALMPKPV